MLRKVWSWVISRRKRSMKNNSNRLKKTRKMMKVI